MTWPLIVMTETIYLAAPFLYDLLHTLMPQSHHTPGSRSSRAVHGLFEQKSYVHSRGPHGPRAAPYEFCLPVRGLQNFNVCIIILRAPYGFWDPKQPLNSPCGDRKGPVRAPYIQAKYDARAGFLSILVVLIPLRVRKGPARAPYESRRIWKTLKIPLWDPYCARTGITWGTRGVLRIIRPNHKCTAVSSRTGPVAWCDTRTDVKILRALRTGDKKSYGAHGWMWLRHYTAVHVTTEQQVISKYNYKAN